MTSGIEGTRLGFVRRRLLPVERTSRRRRVVIAALQTELLLDFDGLSTRAGRYLEPHHIVAEDVQVVDAPLTYCSLLTLQGPRAAEISSPPGSSRSLRRSRSRIDLPPTMKPWVSCILSHFSRAGLPRFDLTSPRRFRRPCWIRLAALLLRAAARFEGLTSPYEAGLPQFRGRWTKPRYRRNKP